MLSDEQAFLSVRDLLVRQLGCRPEAVTLDTRLAQDLGVAGDDAAELLQALSREFGVDISTVRFKEHFVSEGWPILPTLRFLAVSAVGGTVAVFSSLLFPWLIPVWCAVLFWVIRRTWRKQQADTPNTVRVRDLVTAVQARRWSFQYDRQVLAV